MNVIAHGIDLVECARLQTIVDRYGRRFLHRVFTDAELQYSLGKKRQTEHLGGRFAAKEAVLKALGVGWQKGIRWTDIEIRNTPSGQPRVSLSGRCRQIAEELGLNEVLISISHTATYAMASAVGGQKK
ncbi:MAG: holo-ACP synthase [Phycisphaerae bacterium]|jgi:holo-[acyl-carrier protein] synthase|nr:holo-ACP synthase [Phycisphaerae bacterium]